MKTSELTGVLLSYWTARAEGVETLLSTVPDTGHQSVSYFDEDHGWWTGCNYCTDWRYGGPLIEKYRLSIEAFHEEGWNVETDHDNFGGTALEAVCRAVVRARFGDEVPDEPV